jgi:hypothetical protein
MSRCGAEYRQLEINTSSHERRSSRRKEAHSREGSQSLPTNGRLSCGAMIAEALRILRSRRGHETLDKNADVVARQSLVTSPATGFGQQSQNEFVGLMPPIDWVVNLLMSAANESP